MPDTPPPNPAPTGPPASGALGRLIGKAPWGVADQMLISASNMVTTVLLARELGVWAYGRYVLVFSLLQLSSSVVDGLVWQPHNVLGPARHGDPRRYRRYTASSAAMSMTLSAASAALILIAAGAYALAGRHAWAPLTAVALVVLVWQGQEFARRTLYTEGRAAAALALDCVGYGGQVVLLALLAWARRLTPVDALIVVGVTSVPAMAMGLWMLRRELWTRPAWSEVVDNWRVGKWLAGGELVGVWLGDGTVFYIASGVLGAIAAAAFQAANTLFGPIRVLMMAVNLMLPIRLAKMRHAGGWAGVRGQVRRALFIIAPIFGLFCVLIAVFAGPLLRTVYGPDYGAFATMLRLFAVTMFLSYIATVLTSALKAEHVTRPIFVNRLIGSLVGLGCGTALLLAFGLSGAVIGMAAGHLCIVLLHLRSYRQRSEADAASFADAPIVSPTPLVSPMEAPA